MAVRLCPLHHDIWHTCAWE